MGTQSTFTSHRIVGWTLGAASLLNVVQDLDYITLVGKLKTWAAAYGEAIHQVHYYLFAWIKFSWISITYYETHAMVIGGVFAASLVRAKFSHLSRSANTPVPLLLVGSLDIGVRYMVMVLIPLVILPDSIGWIIAVVMLKGTIELSDAETGFEDVFEKKEIQRLFLGELMGVVGVFLLAVAANYGLTQHHGG